MNPEQAHDEHDADELERHGVRDWPGLDAMLIRWLVDLGSDAFDLGVVRCTLAAYVGEWTTLPSTEVVAHCGRLIAEARAVRQADDK